MIDEGTLKSFVKDLLENFVVLAFSRKVSKSSSQEGKPRETVKAFFPERY